MRLPLIKKSNDIAHDVTWPDSKSDGKLYELWRITVICTLCAANNNGRCRANICAQGAWYQCKTLDGCSLCVVFSVRGLLVSSHACFNVFSFFFQLRLLVSGLLLFALFHSCILLLIIVVVWILQLKSLARVKATYLLTLFQTRLTSELHLNKIPVILTFIDSSTKYRVRSDLLFSFRPMMFRIWGATTCNSLWWQRHWTELMRGHVADPYYVVWRQETDLKCSSSVLFAAVASSRRPQHINRCICVRLDSGWLNDCI